MIKIIALFSLLLFTICGYAFEKIEVQALMPGLVVLSIDGQRHTLKVSDETDHGIKLISADNNSAVLEINGQQKIYTMLTAISTNFTERQKITEQVMVDKHGMFRGYGSINGQTVKFLVDTGATTIALSSKQARKLGIQYRLNGKKVTASTASGLAQGWEINLKSVRFGKLLEKNVTGIVVDGDYPRNLLLGMSFLNRMKVEKTGNKMIITQTK